MLNRYWYAPKPAAATPSVDYIASVLALSPSAGWGLQEASGNPADLTGNGWGATAVGASITYEVAGPTINGEVFKGVTLPGSSSGYFTVGSTLTDPSSSGFTVSAWVKHPAGAGPKPVFYWIQSGQGTFWMVKGNSYGTQIATYNTVNGTHGIAYHGTDLDDTWTWVGGRYDTSGTPTLRAYQGAVTSDTTSFTGTWANTGNPACVIGGGGATYWNGELALVFYWNTPLSDANMTKLRTGVF